MIALALVLFFGITGITLNHPDWTFGFDPTVTDTSGTLPPGIIDDSGAVDFLALSEYLRNDMNVSGTVTDYGESAGSGFLTYRNPGYAADVAFDVTAGTYDLRIEEQGLMAVMNDLHKGRNTAASWNWTIDAAGVFLVAIAVTGLGLQLFLKKRRKAAMVIAVIGFVVAVVLISVTLA